MIVPSDVTAAPSPFATALAKTVPDTNTEPPAPVTLAPGIVEGIPSAAVLALNVVGVPETVTVTTVLLVRTAAAALSPGGSPVTAKLAGVIDAAYVPLESVKTTLAPLTA